MFSIIIPTFNSENTIKTTIDSILKQTFKSFEILVIDNHSTDKTEDIISSFEDNRIKFYKIHNNGMPAVSRNFGIKNAKNEFIAFCDSDDLWSAKKLIICKEYIDRGHEFIAHDVSLSGSKIKNLIRKTFKRHSSYSLYNIIHNGNPIAQSSVVIKKSILDEVGAYSTEKKFTAIEDAHLWIRILKSGRKLEYVNIRLGTYYYSKNALSYKVNQFRANRALRLEFFSKIKPAWYKYNIATYLIRKNQNKRAIIYLKSLLVTNKNSLELQIKCLFLIIKTCIR